MPLQLQWVADPDSLGDDRLAELVGCWTRVSNAGGAVGFPFLPVDQTAVTAAADDLRASLDASNRLLLARHDDGLAGWLMLQLNRSPVAAHWGVVSRVQTDLEFRGAGHGRDLMVEVARMALSLGLEQLHIAVRGGQRIEDFYRGLGWQEVGRWPSALRLGPDDDRDEILMMLTL